MPPILADILDFAGSDAFNTVKIGVLAYFGLLWLAIIIWVTRDALGRSNNILFQAFAILLNILVPFLGILLYLIIRPGKTTMERYYEELERNMLESGEPGDSSACDKCLTPVDREYGFCPNCGQSLKKKCPKCKKTFPNLWNICPYCGDQYEESGSKTKKSTKK
jgi:RNA polymerase subunit RPABC4/transcription elongation factor Spt4